MTSPPLFVFGPARGGTTYLTRLLDSWFDYGMGPEGTFIKKFYERRSKYGDLSTRKNMDRLVGDLSSCEMLQIMRHAWAPDVRVDITPALLHENIHVPSFSNALYAVLAAVAKARHKSRIGSKEPAFWRYWPILEELFPERARYLCVIRDGRDVALSLFRESWGERSAYIAAKNWVAFMQSLQDLRQSAADRLMVIRYETLLLKPDEVLIDLEHITETRLPDRERKEFVDTLQMNPLAHNFNKWKEKMAPKDIDIFEAVAGHWLESYGYDLVRSGYSVKWYERAFYEAQEVVRKSLHTLSRITGPQSWEH